MPSVLFLHIQTALEHKDADGSSVTFSVDLILERISARMYYALTMIYVLGNRCQFCCHCGVPSGFLKDFQPRLLLQFCNNVCKPNAAISWSIRSQDSSNSSVFSNLFQIKPKRKTVSSSFTYFFPLPNITLTHHLSPSA